MAEVGVAAGEAKRQRIEGAMPEDLRRKIEKSLEEIGEVDFRKRSHHGSGPMKRRVLPPEDLVHEKVETIRKGTGNRVHYRCSNPKCEEPIRNDK